MEMIRNQRPAIAGRGGLLQNRTDSFQKSVSIGIVFKNVSSLDTSEYDMMQSTRRIYSGLTWHVTSFPHTNEKRNAQFQHRPSLRLRIKVCRNCNYPKTNWAKNI